MLKMLIMLMALVPASLYAAKGDKGEKHLNVAETAAWKQKLLDRIEASKAKYDAANSPIAIIELLTKKIQEQDEFHGKKMSEAIAAQKVGLDAHKAELDLVNKGLKEAKDEVERLKIDQGVVDAEMKLYAEALDDVKVVVKEQNGYVTWLCERTGVCSGK